MTLTEFLLARIKEDENRSVNAGDVKAQARAVAARTITLMHRDQLGHLWPTDDPDADDQVQTFWCTTCAEGKSCSCCLSDTDRRALHLCPVKRLLASPYAAHPDYDEAWRP